MALALTGATRSPSRGCSRSPDQAVALTGATRSPSRGCSRSPDQAPATPSGFRSRFPPSGNSPVALALTGVTRSPSRGFSRSPDQAPAPPSGFGSRFPPFGRWRLRFKFFANNRPNAARHVTVINDEIPSAQPPASALHLSFSHYYYSGRSRHHREQERCQR